MGHQASVTVKLKPLFSLQVMWPKSEIPTKGRTNVKTLFTNIGLDRTQAMVLLHLVKKDGRVA